jgi:Uma2 family endonuclease
MSVVTESITTFSHAAPPPFPRKSLAELLHELGDIPAHRVRLHPYPGTATEADAVWVCEHETGCELINGTIVENTVGMPEDYLGTLLSRLLLNFVLPRRLGLVVTGRPQFRMGRGNLREPDVSFTRGDRLPSPLPQVGGWCPDLCVEVLSPDNTRREMAMKRVEYFAAGCRLVWEIDPRTKCAVTYVGPEEGSAIDESGTLDGGDVLPGFTLSLRDLFGELDALTAPPP